MANKLIRFMALILSIVLLLGIFTACQVKSDTPLNDEENGISIEAGDSAVVSAIKKLYLDAAKENADMVDIAAAMSAAGVIPYNMDVFEIKQGTYLNGFSAEPTGFSRGVCFCPFIGTIPFVGYIFEAENPEQFLASLKESAMLDWNICTQADEVISGIDGNRVLFVMTPSSFDD